MEVRLRNNLFELARLYTTANPKTTLSAIGRLALKDNTFFGRLQDGVIGFNIRTHDRLVCWFSDNWPSDVEWPVGIERPRVSHEVDQ